MSTPESKPKAFGSPIPYAEPLWYSRNVSPYYTASHRKLREAVRKYLDEEVIPFAFDWESSGQVPDAVCGPLSFKAYADNSHRSSRGMPS